MHIQNTADNRSGYRVDLQNALVFGGLSAADWCVTFHILPGLEGGSLCAHRGKRKPPGQRGGHIVCQVGLCFKVLCSPVKLAFFWDIEQFKLYATVRIVVGIEVN